MTEFRRTLEILLATALVAGVAYCAGGMGKVSESDAKLREARAQEQGYKVARLAQKERAAQVDTITRRVITQGVRIDTAVNRADTVLADTGATVTELRHALAMLRTEVVTYRVTVDSLVMSHLAYREATDQTLLAADSTISALKEAVAATEREGRRKFWRGVMVGGLVGAVAVTGGVALILLL